MPAIHLKWQHSSLQILILRPEGKRKKRMNSTNAIFTVTYVKDISCFELQRSTVFRNAVLKVSRVNSSNLRYRHFVFEIAEINSIEKYCFNPSNAEDKT